MECLDADEINYFVSRVLHISILFKVQDRVTKNIMSCRKIYEITEHYYEQQSMIFIDKIFQNYMGH